MTTTTTIAVPMSCAALCTKLAGLVQRIDAVQRATRPLDKPVQIAASCPSAPPRTPTAALERSEHAAPCSRRLTEDGRLPNVSGHQCRKAGFYKDVTA
jgi:hypothetical protein